MKVAHDSCWCWRRILENWELVRQQIFCVLGDSISTDFLSDSWHPKRKLEDWVDQDIITTLGVSSNIVVVDFISNGQCDFPGFMEDKVNEVTALISTVELNVQEKDQMVWKVISSGKFSMKETYAAICSHNVQPIMHKLI